MESAPVLVLRGAQALPLLCSDSHHQAAATQRCQERRSLRQDSSGSRAGPGQVRCKPEAPMGLSVYAAASKLFLSSTDHFFSDLSPPSRRVYRLTSNAERPQPVWTRQSLNLVVHAAAAGWQLDRCSLSSAGKCVMALRGAQTRPARQLTQPAEAQRASKSRPRRRSNRARMPSRVLARPQSRTLTGMVALRAAL